MATFDLGLQHKEEEVMDIAIGDEYTLYTGGCEGVDQTAEEMGLQLGFKVHVLVGPQHPRARTVTPLSTEKLEQANPFLRGANQTLRRHLNFSHPRPYYMELLQRNYHIIRQATHVYAFGELQPDKKTAKGGTGWSVQLALDANKTVYFYDIPSKTWHEPARFQWKGHTWVKDFHFKPLGSSGWSMSPLHQPLQRCLPTLHKASAVVGSRRISPETVAEIKALFHRTFQWVQEVQTLPTRFTFL